MLLVLGDMSGPGWDLLSAAGAVVRESSFSYLAHPSSPGTAGLTWYQVITLRGQEQVVANELRFQADVAEGNTTMVIEEYYDLQGLNITSYTLSWAPYMIISKYVHTDEHWKMEKLFLFSS